MNDRPPERDRLQNFRKSVRVFGMRKEKFLEFDFIMGSEELTIELVMPYPAFREFCETNHVAEIAWEPRVRAEFDRLAAGRLSDTGPESGKQTNIIQLGDYK